MTSAPPETTTPAPTEASQPPEVGRGLWAVAATLLLLAFWAHDTLLAAPGALLFALAMIPATRTLGEHGRWARWTAAGVFLMALLVVGLGAWEETQWTLLLWAGVVGSLVWAATGWERWFAEREDEERYMAWYQLRRRGLLLVHLLVLGGGVALAAPQPTSGWAGLLLFPLFLFGVVWGIGALQALNATVRAVSTGWPRRHLVSATILVIVVGLAGGAWATASTELTSGRVVVDAEQARCELLHQRAGSTTRIEHVTRTAGDSSSQQETVGPFQVWMYTSSFDERSSELTYDIRARRPFSWATQVQQTADGFSISGLGAGALELTCRPDLAMPPGSAPAP